MCDREKGEPALNGSTPALILSRWALFDPGVINGAVILPHVVESAQFV